MMETHSTYLRHRNEEARDCEGHGACTGTGAAGAMQVRQLVHHPRLHHSAHAFPGTKGAHTAAGTKGRTAAD